jgi:hypothetical protein
MMTTRESGARKPKPMQCLLLAPEQDRQEVLRQFLAENVERHASKVDETACLTEFQQRSCRGTRSRTFNPPSSSSRSR